MLRAPIPHDEAVRQQDLLHYDIMDSAEDADFSALVELATAICNCTSGAISFIDNDRQWFKSSKNIPSADQTRANSFCGHAILQGDVMVINDTAKDERFFDNPNVVDLKIGFYAGAPIISSAGHKIGTVCVLDSNPKISIDENQKNALAIIAAQVMKLLELRFKNKLIVEQANSLLLAEKNLAKLNMIRRERENNRIAYELHENIAQMAAAAKMNLENADDAAQYAETAGLLKNYLSVILNDVKALSDSIIPTTFTAADYKGYILDLAAKTLTDKKIEVMFNGDPSMIELREKTGLTVYRIFQYTLDYAALAGAEIVSVGFSNEKEVMILALEHNGHKDIKGTDEGKMLINNIITRAGIINAVFEMDNDCKKITIRFPEND